MKAKRDLTLKALESAIFALRQAADANIGFDNPKSAAIGKLADAMQIRANKIVANRKSRKLAFN